DLVAAVEDVPAQGDAELPDLAKVGGLPAHKGVAGDVRIEVADLELDRRLGGVDPELRLLVLRPAPERLGEKPGVVNLVGEVLAQDVDDLDWGRNGNAHARVEGDPGELLRVACLDQRHLCV